MTPAKKDTKQNQGKPIKHVDAAHGLPKFSKYEDLQAEKKKPGK